MPRQGRASFGLLAACLVGLPGSTAGAASCLPDGFGPQWLEQQERSGGHTLQRHVGKSDRELIQRLVRENKREDSSFKDRLTAETSVATALEQNRRRIEDWAGRAKPRQSQAFHWRAPEVVGRSAFTAGDAPRIAERRAITTVLAKNPDGSCRLITAYPSR
jgi:hypothetical protein